MYKIFKLPRQINSLTLPLVINHANDELKITASVTSSVSIIKQMW
jgi:hypothetical protein